MRNSLPQTELAPADVLLYRGRSWVSRAIRLFDGAPVSHAALFLEPGAVAEATGQGVVRRDLATSVTAAERILVRRLEPVPATLGPVLARARAIVGEGHRYAYEQIVLLAFLCLTRRLVPTRSLARLVRGVLDAAAEQIAGWLGGGKQPMICSEFVYRAYDEAEPAPRDPYALDIVPWAPRARIVRTVRAGASPSPGARGRGRGLHRESLLARLAGAEAEGSRPRRLPPTRSSVAIRSVSDDELQRLLEAHERERRARTAGPAALRLDAEMRAAIERFAAAWARVAAGAGAAGRAPLEGVFAAAADFVTPGDLLRTRSLHTLGPLDLRTVSAASRTAASDEQRRDPGGKLWTQAEVQSAAIGIVARLTPGVDRRGISPETRFGRDLGWDEWYMLRLRAPVRRRFRIDLPAARVKDLEEIASLVEMVWEEMEEVS